MIPFTVLGFNLRDALKLRKNEGVRLPQLNSLLFKYRSRYERDNIKFVSVNPSPFL